MLEQSKPWIEYLAATATAEAVLQFLPLFVRCALHNRLESRSVWRWDVGQRWLEFALAADILRTAIAPTWLSDFKASKQFSLAAP